MRHYSSLAVIAGVFLLVSCGAKSARLTKAGARNAAAVCNTDLQPVLRLTTTGTPVVGQDVFFRLEVSGCSGEYKLSADDTVFNDSTPFFFSRRYTTAGSVKETVLVQDANFPTKATTAVAEFTVGAASSGLTCQAAFNPSQASLNSSGIANVAVTVTPSGAASTRVVGLLYLSGGGSVIGSTLPTAASTTHVLNIQLNALGQHFFAVDIADAANAGTTSRCFAVATVFRSESALSFLDYPVAQFGAFNVGAPSPTRTLLVANTSSVAVQVQSVILVSQDFSIQGGTCTTVPSLNPGEICGVIVRFEPSLVGSSQRSASLAINYRPPTGTTLIASLSVQGSVLVSGAALSLSPAGPIDFGTVAVGATANRTITVRNAGPASATLGSLAISNAVFEVTSSTCPQNQILLANSTCTVQLRFAPSTSATYNSNFILSYTDAGGATSSVALLLLGIAEGSGSTVSSGMYTTCAIRTGGALYCWGWNSWGQIGDGTISNRWLPALVSGMESGVTSVSVGHYHACAIQNGGVKCWGYNGQGQLGDNTVTARRAPTQVQGLTANVTAIAVGSYTSCAIQAGALKCWGYNAHGQLGDGTLVNKSVPTQVSGMESGVSQISVANEYSYAAAHACAIQNGAVKCWGYNGHRQLGGAAGNVSAPRAVDGLGSGVSFVQTYHNRTCVIQNGAAKCWGYNGNGQVGDGTRVSKSVPTFVSGLDQGVTALGGGTWHSCAVKMGRMVCWGFNAHGQLGDGTVTERITPVQVSGMETNVTEISKEDPYASCAMKAGKLYCWGYNGFGQLGDGSVTSRHAPGLVSGY